MNDHDTKAAVRRLGDMIAESIDDAELFQLNELVDVETIFRSVQGFLDSFKERGPIVADDIGVKVELGDNPSSMLVTLTGKTPEGNLWLAQAMSRKGRNALPFSVPQDPPADMDTRLVAAMPLLNAYYDDNMTWGAVHIVLDDGNVADHHVDHCIEWAIKQRDTEGEAIARLLRAVTAEQRHKLHEWWYGSGEFRRAA